MEQVEEKNYKTEDQIRTETALIKNMSFQKTKTVAFKHMLDLADDQSKLVEMAEQWDGSNLNSLHPTKMLSSNTQGESLLVDDGDGSSCYSNRNKSKRASPDRSRRGTVESHAS